MYNINRNLDIYYMYNRDDLNSYLGGESGRNGMLYLASTLYAISRR